MKFVVLESKIRKWVEDFKRNIVRESKETKITFQILTKMMFFYLGIEKEKVTPDEIRFLKQHSKDLAKIFGLLATLPIPLPIFTILIALKKFGIDFLPSDKDLDIPDNYK
jgi:hypothetical protein